MHSEFPAITDHIASQKVKLSITTNGLLFTKENIASIIKHNITTKISINAGSKETYEKIMKNGKWDILNKKLGLLQESLKTARHTPSIKMGFVAMRSNYLETEGFLDLAAKYGIRDVYFDHVKVYYNSMIPPDDSMYRMRQEWDEQIPLIRKRAKERGITISSPLVQFSEYGKKGETFEYQLKKRTKAFCSEPYSSLVIQKTFLDTNEFDVSICGNQMVKPIRIKLADIQTTDQFKKLWNHAVFEKMRHTCNTKEGNPLCNTCKKNDKRLTMADSRYFDIYSSPDIIDFLSSEN